jgi:hypothetical protein
MTNFRLLAASCVVLGLLVLATTSRAQQRDPIIEKIAKAYGLESYDKIEAIRVEHRPSWVV